MVQQQSTPAFCVDAATAAAQYAAAGATIWNSPAVETNSAPAERKFAP